MRNTSLRMAPILLAMLTATAVGEVEPADLETLRQEQRQRVEEELERLPDHGTHRIEQVVQFRLENGDLVAHTELDRTEAKSRITIPGLPGLTTIHVLRRPQHWPAEAPSPFQFIHYDFAQPDTVFTLTSVFSGPGFMNVSRDIEAPLQSTSIQLIQTFRFVDPLGPPAEDPVRLYVQSFRTQADQRTVDLVLTADSFESLRRNHPREVAMYLEPIFRDLGSQAVIAVDPRAAWQVFADRFESPPAVNEQLQAIIPRLDAEGFQEREAASEALEALGQPAALAAMAMDRGGLTAEQNSRLDDFLRPYRPLDDDETQRLRSDRDFLLNVLLLEDRPLREAAWEELRKQLDPPLEFDLDAPAEQRADQIEQLRSQLSTPRR